MENNPDIFIHFIPKSNFAVNADKFYFKEILFLEKIY